MPTCEISSRQTPPSKMLARRLRNMSTLQGGRGETPIQKMCLFFYLRKFFRQQSLFERQFQYSIRLCIFPKCIRHPNVSTGCMHLVTTFAMLATFEGRCNFTASSKLSSYLYCAPEMFRRGCQPSWYTFRLVAATLRSVSGPCFYHILLMIAAWHKVVDVVAT